MTNVAITILRDIDTTEREPLRVGLDQSVLEQMGWQTGDAITLVSEVEESQPGEGKLIIRKATPESLP